jgi:YVTN family beta-propeller protein
VALTTANLVVVINTATNNPIGSIRVGLEPVALAIRPGTDELWVSNHVSDTVSIVDVAAGSPTRHRVVDTVQRITPAGATDFDEPAGIAFTEDGARAFVALSSTDRIAVIDAASREVTGNIKVRAQDPRAIAVRNGRLYVAAFESGNQSELSACPNGGTRPSAPSACWTS